MSYLTCTIYNYDLFVLFQNLIKGYFNIHPPVNKKEVKKFAAETQEYRIDINNLEELLEKFPADTVVSTLLASILGQLTKDFEGQDRVGITISAPGLEKNIFVLLTRNDQLSVERIMSIVGKILQSNQTFILSSGLIINILRIKMPKGGTRREQSLPHHLMVGKKKIIKIINNDNMCCARALVVARAAVHS